MYSSPKDTEAQMQRFIAVLAQHRAALEQQREDIEVLLTEITAHEKECQRILKSDAKLETKKVTNKKAVTKKVIK